MVFANLSGEDKDAFFALLDEYFSSRPELASALGLDLQAVDSQRAPAPAPRPSPKPTAFAAAAGNADIASAVGRVAAASRAFGNNSAAGAPPSSPSPPVNNARPPPPPRRTTSTSSSASATPSSIVTMRKLGDLDTSSGANMFWGMRKKEGAPPPAPVPAALPKSKTFAPPPVRRGTLPVPRREPTPEPEEEEGEWAEALYDYNSADPNDLPLRENQRVLVTARTSDDWWTGEADEKSGLFPATYVKLL